MPLEIPKSPVQHLHHRASGFSIPGRLPCLLAVVLGLFAHSEASAQQLTSLTIVGTDGIGDLLTPAFDADRGSRNYTATVDNAETRLTVDADSSDGSVEYLPDGTVNASGRVEPVPAGTTRITVKVTLNGSTDTRDYFIDVTRPRDLTLDSLSVTGGGSNVELTPPFVSGTRNSAGYAGTVDVDVTQVTVAAVATSPTAELTWDPRDGEAGGDYQLGLVRGPNTIRLSVTDGGRTDVYTINVTKTYPPGAPGNLEVTAEDVGKQVTLSWRAPADDGGRDITGYEYAQYLSADAEMPNFMPANWEPIPDSRASTTSHTVTGLTNGTTYYFQVRATNSNGPGNGSPEDSATPASAPSALREVEAEGGNERVKLTWGLPVDRDDPDNPISNYQYRQKAGSGSYGGWTNISNSGVSTTATTASYTVTRLTNGTTYYFQVRATNHVGIGGGSDEVTAMPQGSKPGVPSGLTAQAGDEEVTLSWTAPANNGGEPITGYEYKKAEESGVPADTATWTATGGTGDDVHRHHRPGERQDVLLHRPRREQHRRER